MKMFSENLIKLRKIHNLTQEDVAAKIGVTRQSVAKWESGETIPDLDRCKILAELFEVSLDDLANYETESNLGLPLPPKGKHLFGMVTVGDKGQIVIPAKGENCSTSRPVISSLYSAMKHRGSRSSNLSISCHLPMPSGTESSVKTSAVIFRTLPEPNQKQF